MKKMFVNFKSLGFVALAAAALTFSSCTKEETIKCAEARDDNYESTTLDCNATATTLKFLTTWKVNISGSTDTYTLEISQNSNDYQINVKSSFGLFVGATPIAPVTEVFAVTKNKAAFNGTITSTETTSTITDLVLTVNNTDITVTGKFDGTAFSDTGAKL